MAADSCAYCGDPLEDGADIRDVTELDGRSVGRMHGAPSHCALEYRVSMLEQRLVKALRAERPEHPRAPISRVDFNRVITQELLMLLQKWDRNAAAQAEYRATCDRVATARAGGPAAAILFAGSADPAALQQLGYDAEQRRRFASDELDRAVAVCCDALFDAVFGKEAA